MKKFTKLAAAVALASGFATPAMAEISASMTGGFVSDYYFRGIQFGDQAAYASIDVGTDSGFYAGAWTIADKGDADNIQGGLEVDFYAGYGFELENGFWGDINYTRYEYTYTSDFEQEIIVGAGYDAFGIEFVSGQTKDKESAISGLYDGKNQALSVSWSGDVFGVVIGGQTWEADNGNHSDYDVEEPQEVSYNWVEVSASGEVAGLDVSAVLGKTTNFKEKYEGVETDTESGKGYIFLDVSKTFDL